MPEAGRVGDDAHEDAHGRGGAKAGSPDVLIDGRAALRVGDTGKHGSGVEWKATAGSTGVFINGKPAVRLGDATKHDGKDGSLVAGSADVLVGDRGAGSSKSKPHDRAVVIDVADALGRPLHEVTIEVSCPHAPLKQQKADGSASIAGLCTGSTVTVHKPLQTGTWDENAGQGSVPYSNHIDNGGNGNGGTPAPDDSSKKTVHAPAPAGSGDGQTSVHLPKPNGAVSVVVPTVHNWVELVYRAFGHHVPLGAKDVALLGVREASLGPAIDGQHPSVGSLEHYAGTGDLDHVDFTREHRAPAYNDLLFVIWTDKTAHHHQHVEVFECTIDASPGHGDLHLPFLREGHLFHAKPGSYKPHVFPGSDVALHVFDGKHEPKPSPSASAHEVLGVAHKEIGTTESPPYSNRQKYGAWYGMNGAYWCAMFVSWVFAHAGKPEIHYAECNDGANHFRSGAWGTYHGGHFSGGVWHLPKAEPGDVVFYQFYGVGNLDHTGIVVRDNGSTITTIEGNTSSGGSGSQDNGGGVYMRTRTKDVLVGGFGRPHYKPKPVEPTSVIRWGGEGAKVDHKVAKGSTMLHHHYFKVDKHGHRHVDPHAERYAKFMSIYKHAANKAHIPYLVVSSRYIAAYAEWVKWLDAHPGQTPGAHSVLRKDGLVSPHGLAHHYLPSYLSKSYAERVLQHAHHMHDKHKAAHLRHELEAALFQIA